MAHISLPLYNDASYKYKTVLEGQNYEIYIFWNDRSQGWYFNLSRENGESLVQGERLVTLYPMIESYKIDGLTGFFWLDEYSQGTDFTANPRNLPDYYFLSYIY